MACRKAPMSPRLLLPTDVNADAADSALQWLRDVVWDQWSEEEIRTFMRGMRLARLDLSGAVRQSRVRLNNIRAHLDEVMGEAGTRAVMAVVDAVTLPALELRAELAVEMRKIGAAIRSHKNFGRAADGLDLPPRLRRAVHGEVRRRLAVLEPTQRLGESLGLEIARRQKQGPQRALPIVRLADVFIDAGFSKRKAFERTATVLREFDPDRYGELQADQVRLRYRRYKPRVASDKSAED